MFPYYILARVVDSLCKLYKLDAVAYFQIKLRLPPLEDYIGPLDESGVWKIREHVGTLEFVLSDLG